MPIPNGYCTQATDLLGLCVIVIPLLMGAFFFHICTAGHCWIGKPQNRSVFVGDK